MPGGVPEAHRVPEDKERQERRNARRSATTDMPEACNTAGVNRSATGEGFQSNKRDVQVNPDVAKVVFFFLFYSRRQLIVVRLQVACKSASAGPRRW